MAETNGVGRFGVRSYVSPIGPLWDTLSNYYSFDSTPNDSKGAANGTLLNGATYFTGKIKNGLLTDGVNDTFATTSSGYTGGDFTINMWWNASSFPPLSPIIRTPSSSGIGQLILYYTSGAIRFLQGQNGSYTTVYSETFSPVANTWYMFTITYSYASTQWTVSINGSLIKNTSLVFNSFGTLNSGLRFQDLSNGFILGEFYNYYHNGKQDDLSIFNSVLTSAQITELYNAGAGKQYPLVPIAPSIVSSGLILNLDAANPLSYSGTGTTWTDLSGSGNNGTLTNGTSYSSANGGTMVFDGVNDYIKILTGLPISNTLSVWFKQPAATGGGLLETNTLTGAMSGSPYLFVGLGADYLRAYCEGGGYYSSNSAYTPTNWYNVTITGSSAGVRNIYMNGVLTATKGISFYGNANSSINIGVGYPGWFKGNVPVVHAYNRVLTQAEITANFDALKYRFGL